MFDVKKLKFDKGEFYFAKQRLKRAVRLAIKTLWLHRLRSLLTVLGIVFGVCSVIAMLAIGEGASSEAQDQIKNLGSQNIIIHSVKPPEEQKGSNARQNYVLDYGLNYLDLARIQITIPGVDVVVPARIIRDYVWNITERVDCEIFGTTTLYPILRNQHLGQGRFFTEGEVEAGQNVCVIGAEMADRLFPIESPLGKDVRIGGDYYRVVGVMDPIVRSATSEEISTAIPVHRMFIPIETAKIHFGEVLMKRRSGSFEAEKVALHEITAKVGNPADVLKVSLAIKTVLEKFHAKKDYEIVVPLELLRRAERTKQIFNIVLGSIAGISLLVGGIGIMNIMLANVTERTREIGIRRALGAKRRDIITQFLVEAVILSGTGGVLGVILGILVPFLVSYLAGMKTIITLWSPLIAFTISAAVGVIFGMYPARRAAEMDPVEALRHD
ncbi:MAG: macB 1 [Verrucomicrobiales bacterium]|nr:macB 1 [Verrucomicrobiales bacterium]